MEVREPSSRYGGSDEGFKSTDVGIIPGAWSVRAIGDVADTSSGTTPSRAAYDRYYRGGHVAWVKTLDLNNGDIRVTDEMVTAAALADTSLRVYPPGSVLVAMYGGLNQIGRTGLLRIPAAVNQALTAIRPRDGMIHPGYLLRVLNHRVDYWRSVASSSRKDPNITGKDVQAFSLALPDICEQQAIAEALSDADALIESLSLLLAKKRQIKQGAMQELLTGQNRLPGFEKDWIETNLGSLGRTYGGLTGKTKSHFGQGQARYITFMNVMANVAMDARQTEVVDVKGGETQNIVLIGDLLFNGSSETPEEVALCSYVAEDAGPLYLNSFCFGFRSHDRDAFCGLFMAYFFRSRPGRRAISVLAQGATRYNISKTALLQTSLCLPLIDEQRAIVGVLASFDADIAAVESRIAKARDLKQGMMQALLTGRVRLVRPA